jgi:hypothetical protein
MPEKEKILFSDQSLTPTDEYIFSIIGGKKKLWDNIIGYMRQNYPNSAGEWNYYNDGKRWLFKMVLKKKTIFWLGILKDTFRITFWFGDKAESFINDSDLPQRIKEEFRSSKKYGAVRAVSVIMNEPNDVDNVLKLIVIKQSLK